MKKIICLLFIITSITIQSQNIVTDDCKTLTKIKSLIEENHYKPKPINDSLSVYVFNTFLEKLDPTNSILIESEVNYLKRHKLKIDNYINEKDCSFLKDISSVYSKAAKRYSSIIEKLSQEPFTYSSKEFIHFYSKKRPNFKTEIDLKNYYKKVILFDVLQDVSHVSKNKDSIIRIFDKVAIQSKNKVFENYKCKSVSYNLTENEISEKFFSTFCSFFDPHTEYFSKNNKSQFLSSVSSDNLTFGMFVSLSDSNEIFVQDIVPGSSAFYSKKIEKGDQIISIKSQNEEIYNNCPDFEKLEKLFSSNDYNIAEFKFRKKNGETFTSSLIKKVMKDYQNTVYSFILEKDNQKMSYIKIPSFYTKIENGKSNMSDDVMKEIFKLKEEKINGLIIDLENNGGGSMYEAAKLCSFFINEPNIAIIKSKFTQETISNKAKNVIYNGSIIILINGLSASASEFFANTMQDYNLAVIMGTKSLGKATIQQILPLENEENQFVKITLGQFYRISGKSNQYVGVNPTIEIPSLFQNQYQKESNFKTALKNDSIKSEINFEGFSMSEKEKSSINVFKQKLSIDKDILKIKSLNNQLDKLIKSNLTSIALNYNSVFLKMNATFNLWSEIIKQNETEYPITILNTKYDSNILKFDEYLQTINQNNIKTIKNNLLIYQSVKLMSELIN